MKNDKYKYKVILKNVFSACTTATQNPVVQIYAPGSVKSWLKKQNLWCKKCYIFGKKN